VFIKMGEIKMDKSRINYCNDVLLGISFAVVLVTAVIRLFNIVSRTTVQIHKIAGIAMIVFSIIHFILHFKVFVNMTKARFSKK
jgi:hypothetical protein